ncbi:MAG TPA: hypothetical protein VIG54_01275, partial [Lysobacter sp.]
VAATTWVGAWALAASGAHERERVQMFAGIAAATLLTAFVVYRVRGRRGRFGAMLVGSIVATAGTTVLLGPRANGYLLITFAFWAQLVASLLLGRLTRRRAPLPVAAASAEAGR